MKKVIFLKRELPEFHVMSMNRVQILEKIDDCWQYLGSTIGGGYVAKPPLSLQLYNPKTQGFF